MKIITDPKELLKYFKLTHELLGKIEDAEEAIRQGHKFRVTEHYLKNVIKGNENHPLLDAILPTLDDLDVIEGIHTSNEGMKFTDSDIVIQKYKPNAIMTLTSLCAQYCTYCFRKQHEDVSITDQGIDKVLKDLASKDNSLIEIILSGGDPLFLPPNLLDNLSRKIEKLKREREKPLLISINTRFPVLVDSKYFDQPRYNIYSSLERMGVNTIGLHILHPDEVTYNLGEFCNCISVLGERSPQIRTIHPMLRGINDDANILIELYTKLAYEMNVFPRDLIMPIPTGAGPSKRLTLEEGMGIMRELHAGLPGNLLPRLVICSPVYGKSYIDPFHTKVDGNFGYDRNVDGSFKGLYIKDGSCEQKCNALCK